MLIQTLFSEPIIFVIWVAAIVVALTVHEFSHGFAAYLQGDHTAEDEGRLTLNPLSHIDPFGFLLLVVAGFGWAKPTPFNPYNLKYRKYGPVLVALAGPISNITLTLLMGLVLKAVFAYTGISGDNLMVTFAVFFMQINVLLAVFNLIPIPPLDGSKVLYTFLAPKRPDIIAWLERYGLWLLLALILVGDRLIFSLYETVYSWVIFLLFS